MDKRQGNPYSLVDMRRGLQVLAALVIITVLYSLLAEAMAQILGSHFLSPTQAKLGNLVLSGCLLVAALVALQMNRMRITAIIIFVFTVVVTLYLLSGAALLVASLPTLTGNQGGLVLLRDAGIVWVINVMVFGVWYWLIDGGGPIKRRNTETKRKDFLFPQEAMKIAGWEGWQPSFFSYLFTSFHFCSTFGPTDAYVLSRRGKLLVVIQVSISLIVLTMVVARAFTIIQ